MRKGFATQWKTELKDIVRGASGGFLFGIPLLYTMEVWWIGSFIGPFRLLIALVFTFLVVFFLNQTCGFRRKHQVSPIDAAMDTVEAMAIGLVCSGLILILIQEITIQTPIHESLGKLIYEGVPFTLGVALANQFLGSDAEGREGVQEDPFPRQERFNATLADISATLIGATVIAFNIAPTDEIPMLAAAVTGLPLLAVMIVSLVVTYCIVFAAGFTNQNQRQLQHRGIFQRPISETIASYLVSLIASAFMLFFFNKVEFADPWQIWLSYTILLGLPAAIGGAAGRLAA
jgi:putative integral membrane protein (TIGR02587 family)